MLVSKNWNDDGFEIVGCSVSTRCFCDVLPAHIGASPSWRRGP